MCSGHWFGSNCTISIKLLEIIPSMQAVSEFPVAAHFCASRVLIHVFCIITVYYISCQKGTQAFVLLNDSNEIYIYNPFSCLYLFICHLRQITTNTRAVFNYEDSALKVFFFFLCQTMTTFNHTAICC